MIVFARERYAHPSFFSPLFEKRKRMRARSLFVRVRVLLFSSFSCEAGKKEDKRKIRTRAKGREPKKYRFCFISGEHFRRKKCRKRYCAFASARAGKS
jgi:hypothetical protein